MLSKATLEPTEAAQRLVAAVSSDGHDDDAMRQRQNKSSALQRQKLEIQGKAGSRAFLLKVPTTAVGGGFISHAIRNGAA